MTDTKEIETPDTVPPAGPREEYVLTPDEHDHWSNPAIRAEVRVKAGSLFADNPRIDILDANGNKVDFVAGFNTLDMPTTPVVPTSSALETMGENEELSVDVLQLREEVTKLRSQNSKLRIAAKRAGLDLVKILRGAS